MKLIYIPIEVKTRELITKLYFIANNINENFIFFIGDKMATRNATSSLGKGIYFYKSINWYDTPHINRVKSKGNIYISLDEEGGVTQSNKSNFLSILNRRSSEKNVSLTDKIFTWGDFDFNGWRSKYKKYKNKIVKTGSLRFDLWRREVYSKIFKDEILYLKKYSPYIFIPSTFINSREWLKKEIEHEKKMNKGNSKEPSSFLKKRIKQSEDSYKSYLAYLKMIKKLSIKFPKKKILIKPHPKENIMDWKKKLNIKNKYSNIIIDNSFDLTPYIAASESVIFTETIAGMQSAIMGKKTISFNVKNVSTLRNYANKCVPHTTEFKTLIKYLNKKSIVNNSKYKKKIGNRFYITSKTTSKIIMENIKKIKTNDIDMKFFHLKIKLYNIFYFTFDSLRFLFIKIKNKIFNKSSFKSYSIKMPGGIKKEEIKKIFRSLGLIKKVKIIRFGKNGYIIHKNFLR